jgi:hypothetical protein
MKRKAKVTGNKTVGVVQSEALAVAISLGNNQFKASTGWLDSLRRGTILC